MRRRLTALIASGIALACLAACTSHGSRSPSSGPAASTTYLSGYPRAGVVVSISNGAPNPHPSGVPVVGNLAQLLSPAQPQEGTYPRVARVGAQLAVSQPGGSHCQSVAERVTVTSPTTAIIVLGTPGYTPGQDCPADLTMTTSVVTVPGLNYTDAVTIQVNEGKLTATATLPHV